MARSPQLLLSLFFSDFRRRSRFVEPRSVATIFFCDPQLAHYIAANPPDDDMGDTTGE